jgi:hypothetical protein
MDDKESQQTCLGIVPSDGEPPGDLTLQCVRDDWEREWAVLSEPTREATHRIYVKHRDYQMQIEGGWTCGCPACVTIRKHLLLEYWKTENLARQAFERQENTLMEYQTCQAGTDAKQGILNRYTIELDHYRKLRKKTGELLWQACGRPRPTLTTEELGEIDRDSDAL